MIEMRKINCIANWSTVKDIGSGCSSMYFPLILYHFTLITTRVKLAYDAALNTFAAIKIAKSDSRLHRQAMANEANLLRKLNHKNIAKIFDSYTDIDWEDDQGNIRQISAIVIELVPKGELFEFINKTGRVDEKIARYHFRQLIDGKISINFIH